MNFEPTKSVGFSQGAFTNYVNTWEWVDGQSMLVFVYKIVYKTISNQDYTNCLLQGGQGIKKCQNMFT